jgi:hypothetical protein
MSGRPRGLSLGRRIVIGVVLFLAVVLFLTYTLVPK